MLVGRLAQDPTYTDATNQAIALLRNPDHFQWYIIPIFVSIFIFYFSEAEKKNWNVVVGALFFYGLEWFFEIINSLFLYIHGTSALWTTPGVNSAGVVNSAYILLVGLNIEISLMFLFMGIVCAKLLPSDKKKKVIGINNRLFYALLFAILCVTVEVVLNFWDALIWEYRFWNRYNPILIILLAYFPLIFFSFKVHDMGTLKKKVFAVGAMYAVDIVLLVVFIGILGWI
jgi:hypothetical protein